MRFGASAPSGETASGARAAFPMTLATLNDILFAVAASGRQRVMLERRQLGWVPISAAELYRNIVGLAHAFEAWGIRKGDRIAILSENRSEWMISDFAILS